jgi:penicillin-binding protein 1C
VTENVARRPGWNRSLLIAAALVGLAGFGAGELHAGFRYLAELDAGLPPSPYASALPVSLAVVDRTGALLRPFTTADGRWRLPVELGDVDPQLIDMLLAYEDRSFFGHDGIDWRSMLRAAAQFTLAGGRIVSGGSTLTMQVARLLEGEPTRSFSGKVVQMLHAAKLDRELSKEDILTLYLTLAPYGGNIEGVRAASLAYFGKEPKRLTTAECALLVALPQSPEARRPDRDPAAARAARDRVLDRVVAAGLVTAEASAAAKREPLPTIRRDFPKHAAHVAQAAARAHPNAREVAVTIDRRLQAALERLAAGRAKKLGSKVSVAIVVADQATGAILGSVGSADLFDADTDGYVDMTQAVRSPGSTLKPLIFGLAFELGLAHPESLIEDRETAFGAYVPVNFDGLSRGTVTVRQALTESLNIPAVTVLDAVGTARFIARLKRAHVDPKLPPGEPPGLAVGLGGVGVTLRQLVSLYAAVARGGGPVVLHDGATPSAPDPFDAPPVLDKVAAWYVADILAGVPPPLNGTAGRIAYKTGTSYGYRDAWSVGFDGKHVVGVWVGRPDGVPVPGITGIAAAAPILFESFDRLASRSTPLPEAPTGVLLASNAELPEPLKHFRHQDDAKNTRDSAPQIAYPANGVDIDLGIATGDISPLVVKIRNGSPPFSFFADGAPIGRSAFARQSLWTPSGPGFVTLSVVDAKGRSDSVKVFLN